jgi:hypothetical protein
VLPEGPYRDSSDCAEERVAGTFLSLRRVVPNRYPLARDVEW